MLLKERSSGMWVLADVVMLACVMMPVLLLMVLLQHAKLAYPTLFVIIIYFMVSESGTGMHTSTTAPCMLIQAPTEVSAMSAILHSWTYALLQVVCKKEEKLSCAVALFCLHATGLVAPHAHTLNVVTLPALQGGLQLTALGFFANWLSLMLIILVAQALGMLLGAAWMNAKTAQTASTVILLTFMLCAGFYVKAVPVWIAWVKKLALVYW